MDEVSKAVIDKACKAVGAQKVSDAVYTLLMLRDSFEVEEMAHFLAMTMNMSGAELDYLRKLERGAL